MASTPPGARKMKVEYMIDKATYDEFSHACSRKGYAQQVVIERAMRSFIQAP